jgi:hypothetical protein
MPFRAVRMLDTLYESISFPNFYSRATITYDVVYHLLLLKYDPILTYRK